MTLPAIKQYSTDLARHPMDYLIAVRNQGTKKQIGAMMGMPYPADPITEPEFVGLTYGEVALFRQVQAAADGSGSALDRILDRSDGKPVNTNVNVTPASYMDFLDEIAKKEKEGIIDVDGVVDGPAEETTQPFD